MTRSTQLLRFMRMREVIEMVGVSRATIYRWMDASDFPRSITLDGKTIAWSKKSVQEWMESWITSNT